METANSTVVLPSVEDRISDELVDLIREKTNGLVKEFTHTGELTLYRHKYQYSILFLATNFHLSFSYFLGLCAAIFLL